MAGSPARRIRIPPPAPPGSDSDEVLARMGVPADEVARSAAPVASVQAEPELPEGEDGYQDVPLEQPSAPTTLRPEGVPVAPRPASLGLPPVASLPPPAAPPRRQQQRRRPGVPSQAPVAPGSLVPPARRSLAWGFQNHDEVIHVFRMEGDSLVEMLPKEYPAQHLLSLGMNVDAFLVRHVAPEYGGGEYLVRGVDPQGNTLGEAKARIAGLPKAPPTQAAVGPQNPNDPRVWVDAVNQLRGGSGGMGAFIPPALGGVPGRKPMSEVMQETLENLQAANLVKQLSGGKDRDDDADDRKIERAVKAATEPLINQINTLTGQLAAVTAAPPPPQESELERYLRFKRMEEDGKPKGPDPMVVALQEKTAALERQLELERRSREEERVKRLEERIEAITQRGAGDPMESFAEQYEKMMALGERLGLRGSSETTGKDVLAQLVERWSPEAIGDMADKIASAETKRAVAGVRQPQGGAKAGAGGAQGKTQRQAQAKTQGGPPLANVVPEKLRARLLAAKDDGELLGATVAVVRRLWGVEQMRKGLGQLVVCIQKADEKHIRAHIDFLLLNIYGKGKSGSLGERITSGILRNHVELCAMLKVQPAVPGKKPAPAPASQAEPAKEPAEGEGKPAPKKPAAKKPKAPAVKPVEGKVEPAESALAPA